MDTATTPQDDRGPAGAVRRVVSGAEPQLGGARVRLLGDRPVWSIGGADVVPGAGTGVPARLVDLVVGNRSDPPRSGTPDGAAGRERAIPVDQTHVSVVVDDRRVIKIVGAWGAADRSAGILERLSRAGSTAAPRYLGAVVWEHPQRGSTALALVSEYVPDSEDGWTWAVDDVVGHLRDRADPPRWPAELGSLTAELHQVLRVPQAVPGGTDDPRGGDRERAAAALARVFATMAADDAFGRRMRARRGALAAAVATIPERSPAPLLIPHGDLHVGQILRTRRGRYLVLDFDGDPQWEPARRDGLDGAARDVAHMLVSIELVAAVAQRRLGRADERAWSWAESARREYLDAYRAVAPELLDEAPLEGLIAEQLLVELSYAERFLPRWRYAPDGVISRRYPRGVGAPDADERLEEPWTPPVSSAT
ncbi:hypothetical protein J4H92_12600 [Leucobacter weissii]|uniref:Glucosamine kinase n=1 Tax=Leucobacter weissii TaxID=1983706 RepID=A0A939SCU1_9MICO|nr:hypothetical protein [Leucobacter weissii]MBO1902785.1 hypothetical protein [Leucobacter weissii]